MTSILDLATDREREYLEAVKKHGSQPDAAKALGVNKRTLERGLARLKRRAARRGYSPEHDMVKTAPDGFLVKGTSTLYTNGDDGTKVAAQWVKTSIDGERQAELVREAVMAACENIKPEKPVGLPKASNSELLNLYVITDYHLGARCWPEETGDDPWDTEIAEDLLVRWFGAAIKSSPEADTAVLAQLGDFLDHDGLIPVTPTSGNIMDADSRYQKMGRVAIRVLRRVVGMLLSKHQRVHVLMAEGNHDITSSVWLREIFYELYRDEPRVTVDRSADIYYCVEHGEVSLFFHHGHLKKPRAGIESVFAAKFREVFGRTKHSYAHMGHLHHIDVKENELMVVEQHRTLSARNAHESRGGWISGRDAKVVTYHRKFGRVGEQVISPQMV